MHRFCTLLLAGSLLALSAVTIEASTVDEVIARHVEAKGGREAWNALKSMKITGSFTAFSQVHPFTLHRKRDNNYHMDHILDDKLVIIGYDGETAWWENHWFQEGAQKISGPDLGVVIRDAEFNTPLFDYADRGFEVTLIGETEVEGFPAIGVELTRPDESSETWYLDPETYLEIARDSPGSDFGRPLPQRTWFEDFREVAGVQIAHLTESQWYTRDRVMRIESIETNVEIDDALFGMPAPPGMGTLLSLEGSWHVAVEERAQPGADWAPNEYDVVIESDLGGAILEERFTTPRGNTVVRSWTYDRFKKCYRVTEINSRTTHLDIQEGDFGEDGRLLVSNTETGTKWEGFGLTFHQRLSLYDIGEDGFKVDHETSTDGGENWFLDSKAVYARPEAE